MTEVSLENDTTMFVVSRLSGDATRIGQRNRLNKSEQECHVILPPLPSILRQKRPNFKAFSLGKEDIFSLLLRLMRRPY